MIYLLDTNTCIRFLNGQSEAIRRHMESHRAEELALCAVVKAELLYGAFKSGRREQNLAKVETFATAFMSLPFDDQAAAQYAEIRARLEQRGLPIGPNDLLIAAIAKARNALLVTHNRREFERVEGLQIEDWEAPA